MTIPLIVLLAALGLFVLGLICIFVPGSVDLDFAGVAFLLASAAALVLSMIVHASSPPDAPACRLAPSSIVENPK